MNIKELIEQAEKHNNGGLDFIVHIEGNSGKAESFCHGNTMAAITGMMVMITDMCKRSDIPEFVLYSILGECIKEKGED